MNKYILKTLMLSALAAPALTSCELDQFPETSLTTETSWSKVSDADNYNTGLLANLRSAIGGASVYVSEVQADLFNARRGTAEQNQVHQWTFTNAQFDGDAVWVNNFNLVSNANNIINNIGKIAVDPESDDAVRLNWYKGTAYFARAYAYANMVVRYCKNYDPATAATTLGLPVIETVDVNNKPARASLERTYDFILSDIETARTLLADMPTDDYTAPNIDAVNALAARVSLNMKNYDDAIELSGELISKYPLISDADEFADMWLHDDGSEIIYQPLQTKDERGNGYSTIFISYDAANDAYNPYYLPSQGLLDLYEENDIRSYAYFAEAPISANDQYEDAGVIFYKYPGNPALQKQPTDFYNMTKAFRVAELYLIAAEASYQRDGDDGGFLNLLRTARGATPVPATQTGALLWKEIQNEWVREMVGEGFRLDCLKRWNEGFKRMAPQDFASEMYITTAGYIDLEVQAANQKFVWEIPSQDLQANKNLVRNWTLQ